jgi:hypothetical protein
MLENNTHVTGGEQENVTQGLEFTY